MKLFVGQQSSLYNLDPFRSSDHDPVIVGLNLNTVPVAGNDTAVTDENTAVDINVLVNDRDTISDFNSQAGDRIVLNNFPTHTFNAGIIIADNLNAAVAAVYNDVDPNVI